MRLSSAIKLFIAEGGFKPETIRLYRRHLLELFNFLGDIDVCEIKRIDLTRFKTYLLENKSKLCTYKHLISVRSLLTFLKDNDIPCLEHFKIDTVAHDHWGYIKDQDVEKALKLSNEKYRTIILLIYTTGLRISEVCNLKYEDINWSDNTIKVVGKGDKPGRVFICSRLRKQLMISPPPFNVEPHTARQYAQKLGKELGIWFHFHALRKSYATNIYRQSHDLLKTSKLLRHSNVSTTQTYAIVEDQELQEFHNKYVSENHEIYCCKKIGGSVRWEVRGWVAHNGQSKKIEKAINKAISDILQ